MPFATTAFRAMGLTTLAVLLPATAATAHPFIPDGATVPAGSLTTMTIEMGHGCGSEGEGGGDPTLEVALQVPDQVSYIEPRDTDSYEASVETDADDRPEVVVWSATDGGVAAPAVPMDIVIDGVEGDDVFLKVFQGCEGFEYRWIGTPGEPADQPAVALTLGPNDPASPPPPPAAPEPEVDSEAGNETDQAPAPGLPDDASDNDNTTGTETDQAASPDLPDEPSGETTPSSAQALGEPDAESDDSLLLPALGAGLLAIAGIGVLLRRRRRAAGSGSGQEAR